MIISGAVTREVSPANAEADTPAVFDEDVYLLKYKPDGTLDKSFDKDGILFFEDRVPDPEPQGPPDIDVVQLAQQTDGKILFRTIRNDIGRLNADGTLDTSFAGDGVIDNISPGAGVDTTYINGKFVLQSDGQILVAGSFIHKDLSTDFMIGRYKSDGTLDTGFGSGGHVILGAGFATDVFELSSGRIPPPGVSTGKNILTEFESNGATVSNFGTHGTVNATAGTIDVAPDGSILVLSSTNFGVGVLRGINNGFGEVVLSGGVIGFDADGNVLVADQSNVTKFVNSADPSAGPVSSPDRNEIVTVTGTDARDRVTVRLPRAARFSSIATASAGRLIVRPSAASTRT